MKRLLLFLIFPVLYAATALASPPNLATESVFSLPEMKKKGYKFVTNWHTTSYYRCMEADNNNDLAKHIKGLVEKDKKRAYNYVENYKENGSNSIILNIRNNNRTINVGFFWNDGGYVNLFVEGPPEAFE